MSSSKELVITREAFGLIRAHAEHSFKDTSTVLSNGDHKIEVDDEVYEKILEFSFQGESVSDTLVRMFAFMDGKTGN